MTSATTPAPAAPEKPRTLWDRVVTSTPIVLTVVATVLAGLSSGEMSRAQYYRSLAAQNQSKVSDQWNLFQAKRIRGTSMEVTIPVLRSATGAGKVSAESLRGTAARLLDDFDGADKQSEALVQAVEAARDDLGTSGDGLRQAAQHFRDAAQAARAARAQLGDALSAAAARQPLTHLTAGTVPERVERSPEQRKELDEALQGLDPDVRKSLGYFDPDLLKDLNDLNPEIPRALAQINARKTERAMAGTLAKITEDQIHQAIDDGETKTAEFEDVSKPTARVYRGLDEVIADQVGRARALYRASQDVSLAGAALPPADGKKALAEVRRAASEAARTGAGLKATADELANDFKGAQLAFDARRYEREARYNQAVAGLYELDVRKASLESDRHRDRSKHFFNAMLAAQAGVTIATFSLAVRFRSVLWGLATLAGLGALAIGAYVYLRM